MLLELEDGTKFSGAPFGSESSASGEVVFNTGLVGYPESLTDPSYRGQILVLTYPLIGNYGVPRNSNEDVQESFESDRIQISGLVVSEVCNAYSHWNAVTSLSHWLASSNVPGIAGIDTRRLTKILREKGTMLGRITSTGSAETQWYDPNKDDLVKQVSCKEVSVYGDGGKKVVLIDCGCKGGIIRSLVDRGVKVIRVPWNHDITSMEYDGLFISNGPGDPERCGKTIDSLRPALEMKRPIFGVCLGHQLLSLAAGGRTYKLKYGHRSQNQPCIETGTARCYITSQNHGYALREESIPKGWRLWFKNANDGTVEGIKHESLPHMSVQFHPEARPGPTDTKHLFDEFVKTIL